MLGYNKFPPQHQAAPIAATATAYEMSMERLDVAIDSARIRLETLSNRLGLVLRPEEPQCSDGERAKEDRQSPIESVLNDRADQVYRQVFQLDSLLSRLSI